MFNALRKVYIYSVNQNGYLNFKETAMAEKKEKQRKDAQQQTEEKVENTENAENTDVNENANEPADELAKALAAAEDYKRKWYAVSAEYDNYRKRTAAATSQAYADGKAEAILKLLPVADTFGYAYDGASDEKTKTGIDKIIKNFNNILKCL